MVSQALQAALQVYFEAKQLMYKNSPEFRFIETGLLKCFHKHPGWPEIDAFYAVDIEPQQAVAVIAGYVPHPRHMLTVFTESPHEENQEYAALSYRALPDSSPCIFYRRFQLLHSVLQQSHKIREPCLASASSTTAWNSDI